MVPGQLLAQPQHLVEWGCKVAPRGGLPHGIGEWGGSPPWGNAIHSGGHLIKPTGSAEKLAIAIQEVYREALGVVRDEMSGDLYRLAGRLDRRVDD